MKKYQHVWKLKVQALRFVRKKEKIETVGRYIFIIFPFFFVHFLSFSNHDHKMVLDLMERYISNWEANCILIPGAADPCSLFFFFNLLSEFELISEFVFLSFRSFR